jgi:hypothetical protein
MRWWGSHSAIGRLRARERLARRRIADLSALAAIGLVLVAIWPSARRLGVLLTGFAVAAGGVEVGVIALARGRARQAADELIDAGIVTRPGSDARELVDNRLRELGAEPSRRRTAAACPSSTTKMRNRKRLGPRPTAMTCATRARRCATLADVRVETPARGCPQVCAAPALYVR